MEITSLQNAKIKTWAKLKEKKYRDRERLFLVEGEHLIEEARAAGYLRSLLVLQGVPYPHDTDVDTYEVTQEILDKLSSLTSKEPWIGICEMRDIQDEEAKRLIILDGVQDPGNLGTIIRSGVSFGLQAIVLSSDCVDVYNEKVIRATQGAIFHIPVYRKDLNDYLPLLKKRNIPIYATALQQAIPLQEVIPPVHYAIVFGNEGSGIRPDILHLCDTAIKIEMDSFESLNVAVAAGICMYYFRKGS